MTKFVGLHKVDEIFILDSISKRVLFWTHLLYKDVLGHENISEYSSQFVIMHVYPYIVRALGER